MDFDKLLSCDDHQSQLAIEIGLNETSHCALVCMNQEELRYWGRNLTLSLLVTLVSLFLIVVPNVCQNCLTPQKLFPAKFVITGVHLYTCRFTLHSEKPRTLPGAQLITHKYTFKHTEQCTTLPLHMHTYQHPYADEYCDTS